MWIVQLALSKPHTFVVMALAIALFGILSITQMAIDIFPKINIPVVSCVWTYSGMPAADVENMITTVTERAFTSTVNDIEHMESMSLYGTSIIKIYLQQGANLAQAVAMVTSVGNACLKQLPPGITPPTVTISSATDVPVLQLGINSKTMTESELYDIANNFVRTQLATIQGATIPFPYGGKLRQVMVDLDPVAVLANGLSAYDITQALSRQNIIAPSGTAKMGSREYNIRLNNMPQIIDQLNNVPLKYMQGGTVYLGDVANVHDGYAVQTNVVNQNGRRAVLFNILKNADASTLTLVTLIKFALPKIQAIVPPACNLQILTDQSRFVSECVFEVVREAVTAAGLTALMMLALLGSWRSTLIVATSIPLAILSAMIGLNILGETINSMTLGGLALAVGMLVDDATVEIENVHRNMALGKHIEKAILDGAQQVAMPALVSTMSICIVFVPVLFLTEPARSLFSPLGLSVVLSMMASYGLSRTIVPLMSKALLVHEEHIPGESNEEDADKSAKSSGTFRKIYLFIDDHFEALRHQYQSLLAAALKHRKNTIGLFCLFYVISFGLLFLIGQEFFPTIDAGQIRLHVNVPAGSRIEQTERYFKRMERMIAEQVIPTNEIEMITDNIGMPVSGVNYAFSDSQTISEADGEILITLSEKKSHSTEYYQNKIRKALSSEFSNCSFYYQPADIVTQIINAGLPAPIDIQVIGFKKDQNYQIALKLKRQIEKVPGAVDVHIHQVVNAPQIKIEIDRTKATQLGMDQRDISNSVLVSLSSSFQVMPNFWLNPTNGVVYNLAVQTPQYRIDSMEALSRTAISTTSYMTKAANKDKKLLPQPQILSNLATPHRDNCPAVVNHYNVQPVYNIQAACQGRDLGGVSRDILKIIEKEKKELPRGTTIKVRGQVESMFDSFKALSFGIVFALILVYLLLVVNFQSWLDPLIILMAMPGAFSGILWALFVTQTNFSVPALMGALMCIGVSSANSILMISFANEQMHEGHDPIASALSAGFTRFRPVMMTAGAMIIGMLPMAIGSGEGGSQNAPLGRAVIGGLSVATTSTLLFVPIMFSILKEKYHKAVLPQTNSGDAKEPSTAQSNNQG